MWTQWHKQALSGSFVLLYMSSLKQVISRQKLVIAKHGTSIFRVNIRVSSELVKYQLGKQCKRAIGFKPCLWACKWHVHGHWWDIRPGSPVIWFIFLSYPKNAFGGLKTLPASFWGLIHSKKEILICFSMLCLSINVLCYLLAVSLAERKFRCL